MILTFSFSAFSSLLGPVFSPATRYDVFLETPLRFFPPLDSIILLSSSREKLVNVPLTTKDKPLICRYLLLLHHFQAANLCFLIVQLGFCFLHH